MPLKRHSINEFEARRLMDEKIRPLTRVRGKCHEFAPNVGDLRGTCSVPADHDCRIKYRANRVVYAALNGGVLSIENVRFTCGNPKCVNPEHLEVDE